MSIKIRNSLSQINNDDEISNYSKENDFKKSIKSTSKSISSNCELPPITFKGLVNKIKKSENTERKVSKNENILDKSSKQRKSINSSNFANENDLFSGKEVIIVKRVNEIKKTIRDSNISNLNLNNLDLGYFSTSCLNLIYESHNIVKDKVLQENINSLNKESVSKFCSDNKELYLKNNLIKLLNKEIQVLKNKEKKVTNVLSGADTLLDNHIQEFNRYLEIERQNIRNNEKKISDIVAENRKLNEKNRNLSQTQRILIDEGDRYVKSSLILMSFASFCFYSLKIDFPNDFLKNNFSNTTFEYIGNEYEVIEFIKIIIDNFSNNVKFIDSDPYIMLNRIENLELNVLKVIEKNQDVFKKIQIDKMENDKEISNLEKKYADVKKERDMLLILLEKEEKINISNMKKLGKEANELESKYNRYFKEINDLLPEPEDKKKTFKDKSKIDIIKNIEEKLRSTEIKLNSKLFFLNQYEKQPEFSHFLELRKGINKENKVKEVQKKAREEEAIKQEKAKERSKRIVIKTRKVGVKYNLNDDDKNKNLVVIDNKANDEASLLYFD